jgi:hypothetical protein
MSLELTAMSCFSPSPNLSRPSGIAYQFVIEIIKGTLKINPSITVLTLEVAFGINHIKGGLNE